MTKDKQALPSELFAAYGNDQDALIRDLIDGTGYDNKAFMQLMIKIASEKLEWKSLTNLFRDNRKPDDLLRKPDLFRDYEEQTGKSRFANES
jgi:hypothetical protein